MIYSHIPDNPPLPEKDRRGASGAAGQKAGRTLPNGGSRAGSAGRSGHRAAAAESRKIRESYIRASTFVGRRKKK
ncbi:MAG: hypothetical protein IPK17_19115 [Chloroflexi bacterium]|uniref:hypothetical protein n=1 Tax=Candidatus Flexifilum breve TaxID=3140694 RepID=UPI0031370FBE|nr:hypothetical protein [Chloroflexota bacterium]